MKNEPIIREYAGYKFTCEGVQVINCWEGKYCLCLCQFTEDMKIRANELEKQLKHADTLKDRLKI